MTFSPTITHESAALPGVSFTVHRIGLARRAAIDKKTLALRRRMGELRLEYPMPTRQEEEFAEQLEIAKKKAAALPDDLEALLKSEILPIYKQLMDAAPLDLKKTRAALQEESSDLDNDIRCIWIRDGLLSIAGGEFDGMTADQLLEYGPPKLADEIYEALISDGRLAGPQAKNSSSPGTSSEVDNQAKTVTTVGTVSVLPGTASETVFLTSSATSIPV